MWAVEIKRSLAPKVEKSFRSAIDDLNPTRVFIVYPGTDRYPKSKNIDVISVYDMTQEIKALSD